VGCGRRAKLDLISYLGSAPATGLARLQSRGKPPDVNPWKHGRGFGMHLTDLHLRAIANALTNQVARCVRRLPRVPAPRRRVGGGGPASQSVCSDEYRVDRAGDYLPSASRARSQMQIGPTITNPEPLDALNRKLFDTFEARVKLATKFRKCRARLVLRLGEKMLFVRRGSKSHPIDHITSKKNSAPLKIISSASSATVTNSTYLTPHNSSN
jgi:hypothetical protein